MTTTPDTTAAAGEEVRVDIDWRAAPGTTGTRTTDAYTTHTPGLVTHKALFPTPGVRDWWTVTHTRTGCHLPAFFPTREQADAFAADLKGVTNWESELPAAIAEESQEFTNEFLRARARHGGAPLHVLVEELEEEHQEMTEAAS